MQQSYFNFFRIFKALRSDNDKYVQIFLEFERGVKYIHTKYF